VSPQERRGDGLTSTPRQRPSWEKRGGWGKVAMISPGVEISIAGGIVAMVRVVLSLGRFFFFLFLFFLIMRYLFLGTKSLMLR